MWPWREFLNYMKVKYNKSLWRITIRHYIPHFLLSGLVGVLVYYLTLTILSHTDLAKLIVKANSIISITCWLLALSFSVVAHLLEDYWVRKF